MESQQTTDAQLWRSLSQDSALFGEIFNRHVRAVHDFCARRTADLALADDLTSVVFLEAWRVRTSVRFSGESARPWLLGVANNVIRNSARSLRRYRDALSRLPVPSPALGHEDSVVDRVAIERGVADALEAMTALSRGEREVVILVFWSGLSYEETALALHLPVGTVRSRVSRARRKLHATLNPSAFEALEVLK